MSRAEFVEKKRKREGDTPTHAICFGRLLRTEYDAEGEKDGRSFFHRTYRVQMQFCHNLVEKGRLAKNGSGRISNLEGRMIVRLISLSRLPSNSRIINSYAAAGDE
ncbi:MAG: hypothetical protein JO271_02325 [Verrucomicrobia bacterium]|nr:hypothetical protein [Verrucomicrobiota bacterium]